MKMMTHRRDGGRAGEEAFAPVHPVSPDRAVGLRHTLVHTPGDEDTLNEKMRKREGGGFWE